MTKPLKFGFLCVVLALLIACGPLSRRAHAQNECSSIGLFPIPTMNASDSLGVRHQTACWNGSIPDLTFPLTPNITTIPISVSPTVATSQTHECNGIVTNGAGGVVTAGAVLRTVTALGVGHDVLCVVLTSTRVADVGGIVFPYITASSPNSSASQDQGGDWEVMGSPVARLFMTNTSGTTRKNVMDLRNCVGGCQTDWQFASDFASANNEDWGWYTGSNNPVLYVAANCLVACSNAFVPVAGTHQFLFDDGTHSATTNPEFALVLGHLAHGTLGSNITDTWGTATCALGTATINFSTAFTTATYQVLLTDQTTAGGARVSAKNVGSFTITCTGLVDSVDYLVLGNPY